MRRYMLICLERPGEQFVLFFDVFEEAYRLGKAWEDGAGRKWEIYERAEVDGWEYYKPSKL